MRTSTRRISTVALTAWRRWEFKKPCLPSLRRPSCVIEPNRRASTPTRFWAVASEIRRSAFSAVRSARSKTKKCCEDVRALTSMSLAWVAIGSA
ncbi:hypothetical protein D3C71_1946520 [compost metagenome]